VDDDRPRASRGESFYLDCLRAINHQVDLEVKAHVAQRLTDLRAHRKRRHELAVHDVDVDDSRAGVLNEQNLLTQDAEVGAEDRRSDLNGHRQTSTSIDVPQCEHWVVAVLDIRTIVWCSPQPGQTDRSS
jgi:hypothetical protein